MVLSLFGMLRNPVDKKNKINSNMLLKLMIQLRP